MFLGRPTLFFLQSAVATLIAFPSWSIQLLYSKLPAKREGDNGIVNLIIWHFRNEKKPGTSLILQLLMRLVTKPKMRSRTQSPRIVSHSRSLLVSKIAKCKPNYIYLYLICQEKKTLLHVGAVASDNCESNTIYFLVQTWSSPCLLILRKTPWTCTDLHCVFCCSVKKLVHCWYQPLSDTPRRCHNYTLASCSNLCYLLLFCQDKKYACL